MMEACAGDQPDSAGSVSPTTMPSNHDDGQQLFVEFDAVLMALDDREYLHPLTETLPVPTLPVGNQPMLAFPLHQIARAGFENVIVVVSQSSHSTVSACLRQVLDSVPIKARIEIVPNGLGSADALRRIRSLIQHDFVVVDADAIFTMPLQDLADLYRIRNAGALAVLNRMPEPEGETYKQKRRLLTADINRHYVAIGDDDVLMFIRSALDIETESTFRLSHRLMKRAALTIQTRMQISGVVILSHWVLDLLDAKKGISSIYGELLPYLVDRQFDEPCPWAEMLGDQSRARLSREMSNNYDDKRSPMNAVYAVTVPDEYYCTRINTITSYIRFQQKLLTSLSSSDWKFVSSANKAANIVAATDAVAKPKIIRSLVGNGANVGSGSVIRDSVIGSGCVIGADVTVTGCFLMDNVVIENGCRLIGTVLCPQAVIQARSVLRDCVIGCAYRLENESSIDKETLFNSHD